MQLYQGDPGELKNWMTTTEKKQLTYELSDVEMTLLANDAVEQPPVTEFIGSHLAKDTCISVG